jgi:hypothetical protein
LGDPIFIDSKQEFKLDGGDDDNADADDPTLEDLLEIQIWKKVTTKF